MRSVPGDRTSAIGPPAGGFSSARQRAGRQLLVGLALIAPLVIAVEAVAQTCPAGSDYYSSNYGSSCTFGTCWATTPFQGSQSATPLGWPGWYYSCAAPPTPPLPPEDPPPPPSPPAPPPASGKAYEYEYNPEGGLTKITTPLTHITTFGYDALRRLTQSTGALAGVTQFGYDGVDQVSSVTDPRSKVTSYSASGLGDQTQEVSPDRGTTGRVFDAAGNLTSSTDARGKVTALTYDALNRPTQATFQGANPITYAWDQGAGHKGRLTTITFTGGNTTYAYDPQGRVTQKRDTHSTGRVFTVNYAWNATTGRLASMTYPGGKTLTFGYDAAGRITSLTVGSAIIANGITYFPFGSPSGWTWGNSQAVSRTFDDAGRPSGFPLGSTDSRVIVYDNDSRISQIKHPTNSSLVQTMGYDNLDRLTSWVDASSSRTYGYDANGNRTTLAIGANNYTYTTSSTSNRLSSTSGPSPARTFAYNAAGSITGDGQFTLTYDDRGRMSQAVKGSTTVTYVYDGLGQRVKKTGPTGVVPTGVNYFVYNEDGQLLGEYDTSGAVIQEYVWLGTTPIGVLRGTTASPTIFYVYADQIDRPWVITNTANQIRWRWDTSPFGELAVNENPSGLGTFVFNLRFPGQYRDAETGLFYNYFRDYDPQTGRYVQSDPIGLAGGINPYGYGSGNPVSRRDPKGLVDDALDYINDQNPAPYAVDLQRWPRERGPVALDCYLTCVAVTTALDAAMFQGAETGAEITHGISRPGSTMNRVGAAGAAAIRLGHKVVTPVAAIRSLGDCLDKCEYDPSCPAWNSPANSSYPMIPSMSMDAFVRNKRLLRP